MSDLAGDSFSTGDVLLEIETDKAQMDVEAQDDGKIAKITVLELLPDHRDWSYTENNGVAARSWIKGHKGRHSDSRLS